MRKIFTDDFRRNRWRGRAAVFGFTPSHRMATSKDSPQLAFRIMEKLDSATDQEAFKK